MTGFKNLFASKTILTTLVGAIFALLSVFGIIEVSAETQATVVAALFAIAGFFRFNATEQLTATTPNT